MLLNYRCVSLSLQPSRPAVLDVPIAAMWTCATAFVAITSTEKPASPAFCRAVRAHIRVSRQTTVIAECWKPARATSLPATESTRPVKRRVGAAVYGGFEPRSCRSVLPAWLARDHVYWPGLSCFPEIVSLSAVLIARSVRDLVYWSCFFDPSETASISLLVLLSAASPTQVRVSWPGSMTCQLLHLSAWLA